MTDTARATTALDTLTEAGVAVWLDDLSRERLRTGNLAELVESHRVVGVTTNPTIFASALSKGNAYDEQLTELARQGLDTEAAVLAITSDDVREAADVLRPVYDRTDTVDGRVSLEVDPRLARDGDATLAQARELWARIDRPNTFIKIPATEQGLDAIESAIADGISVNVTLIFSLERYGKVLEAYLTGLERAHAAGKDLAPIGSVASFFVSRVDAAIDPRLDEIGTDEAKALRGKAAIANARLAYALYEEITASERWQKLAAAGAKPQRPLWASTGVKNEDYPDTLYVTELVVSGTVNTMPEKTLEAFADHGEVRGDTVTGRAELAQQVFDRLAAVGVDFDDVLDVLEREGVEKFSKSWAELVATVEAQMERSKG